MVSLLRSWFWAKNGRAVVSGTKVGTLTLPSSLGAGNYTVGYELDRAALPLDIAISVMSVLDAGGTLRLGHDTIDGRTGPWP